MKRLAWLMAAIVLAAGLAAWNQATSQAPGGGEQSPQKQRNGTEAVPYRLAGARPAIDAGNYATLQAAIDALPATGGVLRIPAGTFEINEPLRITQEDVLIEGSGTATHIKNMNAAEQPAIEIGSTNWKENRRNAVWRVSLQNLRVTGNEKSGDGILAHQVNEILLHGVTSSYHGGSGIHLDYCYEDPRVCDCLLTYNKAYGLLIDGCHDIVVVGNQFEENLDALICKDGFNLCMTGNNLDDHLRHGVIIENTYGSVVSGNMIEECKGIAIILDRDCYGISLTSNVIAHEIEGGIDLRDAHGCAVSANTFTLVKKNALRIGTGSNRITVTGNNFANSFIGDGAQKRAKNDQEASGIVLSGTSDITITGNSFAGLSGKAVAVEGEHPQRVLFTGNVLTEVESDHALLGQGGTNLEAR